MARSPAAWVQSTHVTVEMLIGSDDADSYEANLTLTLPADGQTGSRGPPIPLGTAEQADDAAYRMASLASD